MSILKIAILGYGDEVNRKIFDRKRLVGQKLRKIWFEVTAEDILTHGKVIGESEDELQKLVWLIENEDKDNYEEEYEHGSDNSDENEGELCNSSRGEDDDIIEEEEFSGTSDIKIVPNNTAKTKGN